MIIEDMSQYHTQFKTLASGERVPIAIFRIGPEKKYEKIEDCPHCHSGELVYERGVVSGHANVREHERYTVLPHFRCWTCGYYLWIGIENAI